ncbi:MAG: dicarboxylate/amino acid:cation symporter [Cyclobacteriaceae bacterium]|jgi:Na+/H+-dicarboxylate symporter|nr:dicarboxylate/amino acid:cation symporter [Cyclobacteriaceae bacterium]
MKKIPLHIRIFIGMLLGILLGIISIVFHLGPFITNWIKPFGTIFINLLKLIAIPLILVSLISGVSNLKDISKLSRIGGKTMALYLITTVIAIAIGLIAVNTIKPGNFLSKEKQVELSSKYAQDANLKVSDAQKLKQSGPLQVIVDIVPDNIFGSMGSNRNMLQVIFFSILFGIALIMVPEAKGIPVKNFFDGVNEVILKIVDIVMHYAPVGVLALLTALMVDFAGDDPKQALELFSALGVYAFTVLLSLALMILLVYPLAMRLFTHISYKQFLKAIMPAQIMAFSTSSSAATLPVTMECVEKNLGVKEEVSSFVLPLGATINMDGTSIHQAVTAVFIAQAFGHDLTLVDQLTIILTATLSSIGAAAVPSAGLITLVIVLGAIGVSPEGLALIIAIDRPLDMCRTIVNITGDAVVTSMVATTENGFQKVEPLN